MSNVKQVKVDNWGIYFLQRLKHFFNRTDYCDLTLQFQDNAQLKVHRLVLSACTEYFELLERTCEMYEDCLVMPDDLQADVVVPIINFMYTGQLEFKPDLLERLYQTSLVLNMPVLTKLLGSHRNQPQTQQHRPANSYYGKRYSKHSKSTPSSSSTTTKRPFNVAFGNNDASKAKKHNNLNSKELSLKSASQDSNSSTTNYPDYTETGMSSTKFPIFTEKNKNYVKESRPTRYELPEELDEDNIFDNSFTNISYTSKPLMVHPETTKQYRSKRISLFEEGSSSSTFLHSSPNDIVECKKITVNDTSFLDDPSDTVANETEMFTQSPVHKEEPKDSSQLFDQIIDNDIPNITIETKNKQSNLDHAKIISEVLKKYPHLVNTNKHIKLKILNTSNTTNKKKVRSNANEGKEVKVKAEPDFTYETDVIDSKEAARLIALGPENVKGPWICLICGTPGKALHFTSYYNFRKHLVEVHNEKPSPNICEYCGLKSQKRNYLVHHQLTKHGVEPPPLYTFPKCNYCKYVALTEALLVKHKLSHVERNFKRNMSSAVFAATTMEAVQKSKKQNTARKGYECMYCLKVFLRESNLYAHLKIQHKDAAKSDGIIEDSDEEIMEEEEKVTYKSKGTDMSNFIKVEVPVTFEDSYEENNVQYQIERRQDGNIHFIPKKPHVVMPATKHKILNPGFNTQHQTLPSMSRTQQNKSTSTPQKRNEFIQQISLSPPNEANEEIVMIDNNEYIVHDFQLYPKKKDMTEYLIPNTDHKEGIDTMIPTTSMQFQNIHNTNSDTKMFIKKSGDLNEPIQIVVSNEDEYKALLNSNQSVIFDEGVHNETLAVLTAPSDPTLETSTIDLDNTQSNNMMIIPEDFPINVSQAVAGDNSNIVVVYSHPVENQNKQYQLITTQNVGGEFVQSSSIITQNYETVTTCTVGTGMSAHTTVESWPIQASISKLPANSLVEMQTMAIPQPVAVTSQTISSNIHEYHEVPLPTTISEPMRMNPEHIIVQEQHQTIDDNFSESHIITEIPHRNINESECQNTVLSLEQQSSMDQQSNVDNTLLLNNTARQATVDNMIDQQSIDNAVGEQSTVNNIINQQCTVETIIEEQSADESREETINIDQTATESNLDEATATIMEPQSVVIGNVEEITPNNFVPVIVEVPTSIENSIAHNTDVIESVTEAVGIKSTEDENNSSVELYDVSNSELQQSAKIAEEQQVMEVVVEEKENDNMETDPPNDEMEVPETIENIARDIGVDPTTFGKHESPEVITDATVDPPTKEIATVEIANLTSEWSEEEDVVDTAQNDAEIPNSESNILDESMEVEESIENIQEEVKKHATLRGDTTSLNSQDETIENTHEKQNDTKSESPVEPKVKISTLLNDWDDNDSQEEDNGTPVLEVIESLPEIGNNEEVKQQEEEKEQEGKGEEGKGNEKDDLNKNDKIKTLVSDWDEDDEDKD